MNLIEIVVSVLLFVTSVLMALAIYMLFVIRDEKEKLSLFIEHFNTHCGAVRDELNVVDGRIAAAGKVLADVQTWREGLQGRIEENKKVVSHKENFRIREVR